MLTRRQLLARGAAGGVGLTLVGRLSMAMAVPSAVTPYLDPLTIPALLPPVATNAEGHATAFRVGLTEITQKLHSDLPASKLWAYGAWNGATGAGAEISGSYPGPTMVVSRGTPVDVDYYNGLPADALFPENDPHILANLAEAHPGVTIEPVRINTHLHGGHVSAAADGNPYRVPLNEEILPGQAQSVHYANDQGAALAWYHDHALGITRSNVMSGLAGGYLITDPDDTASGLPPLARDIPLILQDRLIDPETGELIYPGPDLPPGREWIPEFFGDVMLVNGGIWPELVVRPRTYRLRVLNGSNARFYNLRFVASIDGLMTVTQIGTDLGYLPAAARTKEILAAPAERCDLIVDFSGLAGQTVELRDNILPPGSVSPSSPLARRGIMRFAVTGATASDPVPSLPAPPSAPEAERRIVRTLEEVMDPAASFPLMALLDGKMFHDPLSDADRIRNGTTVEWDLVNLTADTHPIHLHLVDFEVVHRQKLDVRRYDEALAASRTDPEDPESVWDPVLREGYDDWMSEPLPDPEPFLRSRAIPAPATERGPKDTVRANPGEVTRIRATFRVPDGTPLPARYVWHCHILEHEDNDMMRPYRVVSS